jgi:hypothetical protein
MSKTEHDPEPWRLEDDIPGHGPNESAVWPARVRGFPTTTANARRIVACVNACAGIPTEALESGALLAELQRLREREAAQNGDSK